MTDRKTSPESGSAIVLIFLAIAMFAALSYVVFRDSRSGVSSLNSDQARLAAQEIIDYSEKVKTAIQTLRLRGCTENEINLYTPLYSDTYVPDNASAPADDHCDVFSVSGGQIQYKKMPSNYFPASNTWQQYWFNGQTAVSWIGTTQPELMFWLNDINPDICNAINKIINGADATTETVGSHTSGFDGTYNLVANGIGDDSGSAYTGKSAGCIIQAGDSNFYSVLIAR